MMFKKGDRVKVTLPHGTIRRGAVNSSAFMGFGSMNYYWIDLDIGGCEIFEETAITLEDGVDRLNECDCGSKKTYEDRPHEIPLHGYWCSTLKKPQFNGSMPW